MPIEHSRNALVALEHTGVLDYNWSADTGVVSLCHLLATQVIMCVCGLQLSALVLVYLHHARP